MKKTDPVKKKSDLYKDKNEERIAQKAGGGKAGIAATEEERTVREKEQQEEKVDEKNKEATD